MRMARVRKAGSSLAWYFSWIALTLSASMRAWAGSYTPQGRSQCAVASTAENMRDRRMDVPPGLVGSVVCDPTRGDRGRQRGGGGLRPAHAVGAGPGERPVDVADGAPR